MYIIVKVHIHRPRLMQTRQIFITFRTFIIQKNKSNPTLNLFSAATDVLHLRSLCTGAGFKTREVKVRSPARKSRTRETDRLVGTPCLASSHALLILGGVPDLAVLDVGRRQVGRVADGAPVVGRQRGHRLCGRVRIRLRCYCVARGDLSEGGDLELHP